MRDAEERVSRATGTHLRPEIAVPSMVAGHYMAGLDFAVTAGWGHF